MKLNVKGEIILFTIPVFIALAILLLGVAIFQFNSYLNQLVNQKVQLTTNILLSEIEYATFISPVVAESLASNAHVVNALEANNMQELTRLLTENSAKEGGVVSFFFVLDTFGTVLLRTYSPNVGDSLAHTWYFQEVLLTGETISSTEPGTIMQLATFALTPVHNSNEDIIGYLGTGVRWDSEEYLDLLQEHYLAEFALFIGDTAVTTSRFDGINRVINLTMPSIALHTVVVQGENYFSETEILGIPFSVVYTPIFDQNGQIVASLMSAISMQDAHAALFRTVLIMVLLAVGGVVVAVVILTLIAGRITKPIDWLTGRAKDISVGNLQPVQTPKYFPDNELKDLADAIDGILLTIQSISNEIHQFNHNFSVLGDVEYRLNAEKYGSGFRDFMDNINKIIEDFINDMLYFIASVEAVADGDFDIEVRKLPGKKMVLSASLTKIVHTLQNLQQSVSIVASNASKGDLTVRVYQEKFKGSWITLAQEINNFVTHVEQPLNAIETALTEISNGNFKQAYITDDYEGSFNNAKKMLNNTVTVTLSYIEEISNNLQAISNGDLTIAVKDNFVGVYKPIQDSMRIIVSTLQKTMGEIQDASNEVAAKINQISQHSINLSEGSQRQAQAIYQLTDSINAIYEKANEANDNTLTAAENVQRSKEYTATGNESVEIMTNTMNKIKSSSEGIAKIIDVITSISFQTNLLALNASVEAARAGEHGKGFSVVADEVRTLAGRSQQSTSDITNLISEASASVNEGLRATDEVVSSFESISNAINEITNIMSVISSISSNQLESIAMVNNNVSAITQVVNDNSQTAQDTSAASNELNNQAALLKEKIAYFKLR
ncbi:MAG: methyl-accepting chemotaxis protein [Defluviitaleaceae bacterium]|nr:methyl-accepting chemotaxis protein [Defluviitaleaceae bacterium]